MIFATITFQASVSFLLLEWQQQQFGWFIGNVISSDRTIGGCGSS